MDTSRDAYHLLGFLVICALVIGIGWLVLDTIHADDRASRSRDSEMQALQLELLLGTPPPTDHHLLTGDETR